MMIRELQKNLDEVSGLINLRMREIAQLKADKAELVSALSHMNKRMKRYQGLTKGKPEFYVNESHESTKLADSLLAKHQQERTP